MSTPTLTRRALNRALLARQWLDARRPASPLEAVTHLAGLQAQQAAPPFTGLWTRLENFHPQLLRDTIHNRQIVRATAMRATLHLLSAADFLRFRASLAPMLEQAFQSHLGKHARTIPMEDAFAAAARAFKKQPLTFHELRAAMKEEFPEHNERVIGYAVKTHLSLLTLPGDSPYSFQPNSPYLPAEQFLGKKFAKRDDTEGLILRYLAAFGPASPADFQAWSGIRGASAHFDKLQNKFAIFEDENGRQLFDLPDAPRPGEDARAPARFLAEFDNVILGHKDRSRIIDDEFRPRIVSKNLLVAATFLVDGFVAGTWKSSATKSAAKLHLAQFRKCSRAERQALESEGLQLLAFLHPQLSRRSVVFE
jgi:hypothetical protein